MEHNPGWANVPQFYPPSTGDPPNSVRKLFLPTTHTPSSSLNVINLEQSSEFLTLRKIRPSNHRAFASLRSVYQGHLP